MLKINILQTRRTKVKTIYNIVKVLIYRYLSKLTYKIPYIYIENNLRKTTSLKV